MATIVTPENSYLSPTSPDAPGPLPPSADITKLCSGDEISSKDTDGNNGIEVEATNQRTESSPQVNGGVGVTLGASVSQEIIDASVSAATKKLEAIVVVDDDDDVPVNCDLVEENLYLGNLAAACDINLLKKYRINHILTIDSCPLPSKITDLPQVTTKYLKVSDMPKEDILQYFEDTNKFIDSALTANKRVLVHCYYGVSRSATLVLAYLMKKYELSLEEAQNRLKQRRSVVGPNYGFLSQLKLYFVMEYKIQKTNLFYKRFRLHVASDKMKAAKVLSTAYRDVIKPDPALLCVSPEPVVFQCRKCRRILACASNILPHTESKSPIWFDFSRASHGSGGGEDGGGGGGPSAGESESSEGISRSSEGGDGGGMDPGNGSCSSTPKIQRQPHQPQHLILPPPPICHQMLFIEPLAWMTEVAQNLQGKLHCPNPNCKSKLGSFSWVMGCLCPCGAKVQPAFYLVPSKVDRSTSVLNIQITL